MHCIEHYKPAQPLALRQLNQRYDNKMEKEKEKFTVHFKESAEQLAMHFGRNSSIHGMNRIFQENSSKYERFFWLLVLIYALLGSIYVCLTLSQRFNAGTFQTVVESTNFPVFRIPFPEIKICNDNQLNWDRLEEAKHLFMPHENDTEKIRLFEMVISLYDNITFGVFEQFSALKDQHIELVNTINFTLVFEFMTWRCEELLAECKWRHIKFNCCDIFVRSKGQDGLCWHFNTLSTDEARRKHLLDNKYPWSTGSFGPKSGLVVRVMLNEEKHYRRNNEKGIWVAIFKPGVFHKNPIFVPANTETVVEVKPVVYVYDNGTRVLPPTQRKCMFNDERHSNEYKSLAGFDYMLENCNTQCHLDYLLSYCNCTMDILFPTTQYTDCKVKDLLCLAKFNNYFLYTHQSGEENFVRSSYKGMICKCIRNCYTFSYVADIRPSFFQANQTDNESIVDLDVYYRAETMFVYRTSLVFGWVDLMVAFGGIVGLFLGCSLISGMELVYFVLVELPIFLIKELKSKAKNSDNLQNKHRNGNLNTIENFQNNHFVYKNPFSNKNNNTMQQSQHYYLTKNINFK